MGLPVLRLPSLVFANIYQSLDVLDSVVLSQCSRRVQDLVSSQEGPRTGRQVAICFQSECTSVQVVRKTSDFSWRRLFTFLIYPVNNRGLTDEKGFFHLNIDGTTWDVKKCQQSRKGDWYCVSEEGCYEKDVLIIVKMLRNLFNCSIFHISCRPTSAAFQKLFVETDALRRADGIYVHENDYDPKDIDFMFDHFVTDDLYFRGYGGPEYRYQKPLNYSKVYLEYASWIYLEKVFEMTTTSKRVELYGAKLISDIDINTFIKWWLTSDNKTLEFLTIARGHSELPQSPPGRFIAMNRSVIMEGIETTPGKKKREEATKNIPCFMKWENGVDIIRKDGVRATILLKRLKSSDKFLFAVWHHSNPDVEEVTDN